MKIGIIGSGRIGSLVGKLWSQAGHEIMFSSRHPESLEALVQSTGGAASVGTVDQAIAFGDVLLLSTPFGYLPEFGRTKREAVGRKIVLETGNPNIARDGSMAQAVIQSGKGTGVFLREWLPGMRVVRAFTTVWDQTLAKEAHREGKRVGIPLASDDEEALRAASQLVVDAGLDPVPVGALDQAFRFDMGTPVYNTGMSGAEVRKTLGLGESPASPSFTRRSMVAGGVIAAAGLLHTRGSEAQTSVVAHKPAQDPSSNITLEIYKGFALNQLGRWDAVIHPDVKANSPAGRDIVGLQTLKHFNQAFITAFEPRTDLIDHFVSGDRGLVTVNLHWTHSGGPFNGIAPTGRSGTSVESFLLRIEDGMVTRWDVADNSLDLANYLHDQGMKLPRLVAPPALIKG